MVYEGQEFHGVAKKARIVSDIIGYGPMPEPTDDAEQRLTITADGRVWLSCYVYGNGTKYVLQGQQGFGSQRRSLKCCLRRLDGIFGNDPIVEMATDAGTWSLEITNTEGDRFVYYGSLVEDRTGLSNFVCGKHLIYPIFGYLTEG